MEYTLTIKECLEDIRRAQKELEKAHYHLRVAIELALYEKDQNEKERNQRHFDRSELEAYRREKGIEGLYRS